MEVMDPTAAVRIVAIEPLVHLVRHHRVMLDEHLAQLYGIPTKALNQAVERNLERFPSDFAFQLNDREIEGVKSRGLLITAKHGGKRKPPRVFTEQGVAMLSSVLRSPMAVKVNIEIMRAFIRMRKLLATPGELITQIQELAKTVQFHDHQIKAITDALQKMMEPPPGPDPDRKFGFQPPERKKS